MKKRVSSALIALVLVLSLLPSAVLAAGPGLNNFQKSQTYTPGQFTDVSATAWYASAVQSAYEYGLMQGPSATLFNVNGKLTVGETVAIASRLHATYQGNGYVFPQGNPWYQPYVDYAAANGIAGGYADYNAAISRASFVLILANAFPESALTAKNTVEDNAIPDVPAGANYYDAVYRFYRAGVLSGTGSTRAFAPFEQITRSEVAVILSNMVNPALRTSFTLKAVPVTLYNNRSQSIYVQPDQVASYLAQGWSRTRQVSVERGTPIRILNQPVVGERDSVGGISFGISWSNRTDKVIKYAHFYVTPYNRVWDPVKCEIRGYSLADCWVTGPIEKVSASTDLEEDASGSYGVFSPQIPMVESWDKYYVSKIFGDMTYRGADGNDVPITADTYPDIVLVTYWDRMWYNNDIQHLLISKVVLEYMDGTKTTLTGDALQKCFY